MTLAVAEANTPKEDAAEAMGVASDGRIQSNDDDCTVAAFCYAHHSMAAVIHASSDDGHAPDTKPPLY